MVSALPRTLPGWIGAALALLLAIALVAEVAHRASVGHVVCSEHGELRHVAEAAALSAHSTWDGAPRIASSNEGEPEHEHCALGCMRRDGFDLALVEPAFALIPPQPVRAAWIVVRAPLERVAPGVAWARGPPTSI